MDRDAIASQWMHNQRLWGPPLETFHALNVAIERSGQFLDLSAVWQ